MVNTIALGIFLFCFIIILFFTFSGKINFALLLFVPLFPLQNILDRFQQFPLGKYFVNIILVSMMLGWFIRAVFH